MLTHSTVRRLLPPLLVAIALAACAAPRAGTGGDAPATATRKTKVVFWSNGRHDLEFMSEQIALFNSSNADHIEVEYAVHTEDYPQLIELAWQSREGPDLFISRPLNITKLIRAGFIEPLDGYLTPELRAFIGDQNLVEGVTVFDGRVYSLPSYGSTFRLIYNRELFRRAGLAGPPQTLQQLIDAARAITEVGQAEGIYGFAINLKTPSNAWNRSLTPMARRSGVCEYNFQTGVYDFAEYKPLLAAFRQLVVDGSMIPGAQSLDIDPLRSLFAEGKIGMYFSLAAEPAVYTAQGQFPTSVDWAAAPIPTLDGTVAGAANIGRIDWLAVSGQSQHKDAAWQVARWLYRQEFQVEYHQRGLGLSVLAGVLAQAKPPSLQGMQHFLPDKTDAVWPALPSVAVEGKTADAVFADYVLGFEPDLDAALADLSARYNQALDAGVAAGTARRPIIPGFSPLLLQRRR